MKRWITAMAALTLLLDCVAESRASIVQVPSQAGLNPADTTGPPYSGTDGTFLANGLTQSAGANVLTFTNANAQTFLRTDQGTSWFGAYPDGTALIQNLLPGNGPPNNAGGSNGGPVTISFTNAVAEFGLSVQQDDGTPGTTTTFSFTVFAGSSVLFTLPAASNATNALSFIGAKDSGGANIITSVVISSTDSSDSSYNNDFVLGPVTFGMTSQSPTVPEPSTLVLLGVGCPGLLAVLGWRRRQPAVA